ncbi:hypothetical protein [Acidianus sp. RZ1]|uniref:hypothetical protein n=1 Tax=Acidianus sp. RZ1 TaxID=1540082 RepID=UPI001492E83B|nr:hypothetical protein [Acidianus sp. RZ1]NON62273.1 hypothetical protein [Acidianus sp. RZ1]
MKLAVLGSNKLVTTTDAILTEIFAGVRPDEVIILAEEEPKKPFNELKNVLSVVGLNAEIKAKVLGEGVKSWRENIPSVEADVADVTPGRKYMAYAVLAYSKTREIRYAYLKEEQKGYKIFGYVPFDKIKLLEMRSGNEVQLDPPKTKRGLERKVKLSTDSLNALINIYSLLGEVTIRYDQNEMKKKDLSKQNFYDLSNEEQMCLTRSGFFKFEREKDVMQEAMGDSFFFADTNIYIKIGDRLRDIAYNRASGMRLLSSRAVYNELIEHTKNTQRDNSVIMFHLGMSTYRRLHQPPLTSEIRGQGDIPLIFEAKKLKAELPNNLVIITQDKRVSSSSSSQGVKSIYVENPSPSMNGNIGEFLYCLSFYKNIDIVVKGERMAELHNEVLSDNFTNKLSQIKTINDEYNYPKFLSELEKFLMPSEH